MVKRRQNAIRSIPFAPRTEATPTIEVSTVAAILRRGGRAEFQAPQRLGFELLLRITSGRARHTVDFVDYPLAPGDVLWIRSDQVHQWGQIAELSGDVVMFAEHTLSPKLLDWLKAGGERRTHWPASTTKNSAILHTFQELRAASEQPSKPDLQTDILRHLLSVTVLRLIEHGQQTEQAAAPHSQIFAWFRTELEQRFHSMHQVSQYAARLGYSSRTLNRAAQANAGMSAKQFIDQRIILEAKRLLAHQSGPVVRVADSLGFDDAANFSKFFQHRVGSTPAEFKSNSRFVEPR